MNHLLSTRAQSFARELSSLGRHGTGMGYSDGWAGISNATTAAGMGDTKAVADTATKAAMTKDALDLFERSKGLQVGQSDAVTALRSAVNSSLATLVQFQPWTDTSWWSSYTSSDIVRSNLQQALANVMIASGQTTAALNADLASGNAPGTTQDVSSTWRPQTEALASVNVWAETAANLPGEVKKQVSGAAQSWGDWLSSSKWPLVGGAVLTLAAVGGGYAYVYGRGARRSNPRTNMSGRTFVRRSA